MLDAMSVPSTRLFTLAKAVSRVVDVSSAKGEKPQSSVVPGLNRDDPGRFQNAVADFFGRFPSWVDPVRDANEKHLTWLMVLSGRFQDTRAVRFTGQLNVEAAHVQTK